MAWREPDDPKLFDLSITYGWNHAGMLLASGMLLSSRNRDVIAASPKEDATMTKFASRFLVAAATFVVAAGTTSAQTMKAEIPFTFRANGQVLPAGTYRVNLQFDTLAVPVVYFHNDDGHHAAMVKANAPHDPPKSWRASGKAMLAFECGISHCSLVEAWGGTERPAYRFPVPRLAKNEPVRTAIIALQSGKGD
jgi:hypothetical protein